MNKKYLDPISIIKCAESVGINIPMKPFDNWDSYEYGNLDISDEEFLIKLFSSTEPKFGRTIIITDVCFKDNHGYIIEEGCLYNFVDEIYPEIHNEGFFQPLDIIFIFPEIKSLVILYHEGLIIEYEKNK